MWNRFAMELGIGQVSGGIIRSDGGGRSWGHTGIDGCRGRGGGW